METKTLSEQVGNFDFHPEVYVYPTPRTYQETEDFCLDDVIFSEEINVYVHIPFCEQICTYCGYLKIVDSKGDIREQYVDAIVKEIRSYKEILEGRTVKTLHFGGGTPSLLSVSELEKIMNALLDVKPNILDTADEVSIETTPELVEYDKFLGFKQLGISRVSMGLQTLVDEEIKLCRRNNFSEVSTNSIKILREIRMPNLVIDLMIGIEGQTVESFEDSVKSLLEYRPETVELYAIGLMPNTTLGIKRPHLMSREDIYKCYDIGRRLFLEAGYHQDCHNRYVIPNEGSFFQEDYLFDGIDLIGFGAGTRTYATNIHYRNNYHAKAHRRAIVEYIKDVNSGILPVKSSTVLDPKEKMRQYAIYHIESIDKKEFRRKFGVGFADQFPDLYSELIELGLAEEDWRRISLTERGLNFRDLICKQLFSDNVAQVEEEYRPK